MGTHLLKNDDQVGLCDRRCFAAGQHVSRRVPVQEGLFLFQRGCRSTPGSYVARMCYCVCCARRAGGCGGGWTPASDAAEHAVVGDCACVSGCCCWFRGQRRKVVELCGPRVPCSGFAGREGHGCGLCRGDRVDLSWLLLWLATHLLPSPPWAVPTAPSLLAALSRSPALALSTTLPLAMLPMIWMALALLRVLPLSLTKTASNSPPTNPPTHQPTNPPTH